MDDPILTAILHEATLLFLVIGSIFALLLGVLFLFSPQQAAALCLRYNRWLSLRKSLKFLEIPHHVDHHLYRQHRAIGLFLLLSATYILYQFAFNFSATQAQQTLGRLFGHPLITAWLLDALLWFLLPVSLLIALFGSVMALKPSALKGLEGLANHWLSTRKMMQPAEIYHKHIDCWVARSPRLFGVILLLATAYNLSILLLFLLRRFA